MAAIAHHLLTEDVLASARPPFSGRLSILKVEREGERALPVHVGALGASAWGGRPVVGMRRRVLRRTSLGGECAVSELEHADETAGGQGNRSVAAGASTRPVPDRRHRGTEDRCPPV